MFLVTFILKEVFNVYKDISLMDLDRDVSRISEKGLNSKESTFGICKGKSSCFHEITDR